MTTSKITLPDWADAELSETLLASIAAGESQTLEFKQEMPRQATDLAKELAAFATSNAGRLLLGVGDEGDIAGISDGQDASTRAALRSRIEGLCASSVRPSISVTLRFALVEGQVVAAIDVAKGSAPVYYVGFAPYLRQLTAARPMNPDEVIDHVLRWHMATRSEGDPVERALIQLASYLAWADMLLEDRRTRGPERNILSEMSSAASALRDAESNLPHELEVLGSPLRELTDSLEEIASERPSVNSRRLESEGAVTAAEELIAILRARWLGPGRFGAAFAQTQRDRLRAVAKLMAGLVSRVEANPDRIGVEDLKAEVERNGTELVLVAFVDAEIGDGDRRSQLKTIGMLLRTMKHRRTPMDGGQTIARLIIDIRTANAQLQAWIAGLAR